jgi:hypothetical protein
MIIGGADLYGDRRTRAPTRYALTGVDIRRGSTRRWRGNGDGAPAGLTMRAFTTLSHNPKLRIFQHE